MKCPVSSTDVFDSFTLTLECVIRPCRRQDLISLRWFGLFSNERRLFNNMYAKHLRGTALMLVLEVNGIPSGQAWLSCERFKKDATAVIWAMRVFPALQNKGLGTRLIQVCETRARERGFKYIEMTVIRKNPGAKRLYERLGYHTTAATKKHWVLHKNLETSQNLAAA